MKRNLLWMFLGTSIWAMGSKPRPQPTPAPSPIPTPAPAPKPDPLPPPVTPPSEGYTSSKGYYEKTTEGFYLKHFDAVGRRSGCEDYGLQLYRGGAPDLNSSLWYNRLSRDDIDYVVDLRREAGTTEENAVVAKNMGYIQLPLTTSGETQGSKMSLRIRHLGQTTTIVKNKDSLDATVELLQIIQDLSSRGYRIYLHCARGEDRTGVILGLLRKCSTWQNEFRSYGGSYYTSLKWLFERVETRSDEW